MSIVKHNKLIETSYRLNGREQFFILYLISKISQGLGEFEEYEMHYSEIESIINFDGKRRIANKSEVFQMMDRLNSEPIIYERGNIVGKSVWLQHMEHNTDTDVFTFSLSERLREYLLQLKKHFTEYNIKNIIYLNSHAIRLYELLKRYEFQGSCELTIDNIKFCMGIEGRYPKFYEFKRWVLLPAQNEIKTHTDICFTFKPLKKEGKKIISLKFDIFENEPDHDEDTIKLLEKVDAGVGEQRKAAKEIGEEFDFSGISRGDKRAALSRAQLFAYEFLSEKGINGAFIIENIFTHINLRYEIVKGYEDLYIKKIWNFFEKKTDAKKKAGAFVEWWKKGRLTSSQVHTRITEALKNEKDRMDAHALSNRNIAKGMTASEFKSYVMAEQA